MLDCKRWGRGSVPNRGRDRFVVGHKIVTGTSQKSAPRCVLPREHQNIIDYDLLAELEIHLLRCTVSTRVISSENTTRNAKLWKQIKYVSIRIKVKDIFQFPVIIGNLSGYNVFANLAQNDVIFFKTLNFIYFTTITHGYKLAMRWSCWVENKYETFSVRENHWNFFPGWKTQTYSCRLWDSNPRPPSNSGDNT